MKTVASGSTALLTLAFKDKNGDDAVPTSATYAIRCVTTGVLVRVTTPIVLVPNQPVEVVLSQLDNAMQDTTNVVEKKRLIVIATYATGEPQTADYFYALRNVG